MKVVSRALRGGMIYAVIMIVQNCSVIHFASAAAPTSCPLVTLPT